MSVELTFDILDDFFSSPRPAVARKVMALSKLLEARQHLIEPDHYMGRQELRRRSGRQAAQDPSLLQSLSASKKPEGRRHVITMRHFSGVLIHGRAKSKQAEQANPARC